MSFVPKVAVSLDYQFLIVPSDFSNVDLSKLINDMSNISKIYKMSVCLYLLIGILRWCPLQDNILA